MRRATPNTNFEYLLNSKSNASGSLAQIPTMSASSLGERTSTGCGATTELSRPVPQITGNASARPFGGELIIEAATTLCQAAMPVRDANPSVSSNYRFASQHVCGRKNNE